MKKRFISVLLALSMVLTLLPVNAFATETVDSGTCGDNLTWTLDNDGILTISGTGLMYNYHSKEWQNAPWYKHQDTVKEVVILNGVTTIGNYAFYKCSSLTSVTIPDSVVNIGDESFYDCSNLTEISLPENVTYIGTEAFSGCSSLRHISIPSSMTYIPAYMCYGCNLTSVTIPKSVTTINIFAFYRGGIKDIYYGGNEAEWNEVEIYEDNDGLISATIHYNSTGPDSNSEKSGTCGANLTWILENGTLTISGTGDMQSYWTPIGSITGDGPLDVAPWSKYGNEIKNIVITSGVTSIGDRAFYGCNVANTIIPNSVVLIGNGSFELCTSLTDVYYSGNETDWQNVSISTTDYGNEPLLNATIHYNSTGLEDNPGDEITFSVDIGKTFTVNVGEQLSIRAAFSAVEGMTENDIMWTTDDPDIADIDYISSGSIGSEITSSIGWINGISPGTVNISVALPDGRTGSVEVQVRDKGGSNITLEEFNTDIYRADLLVNRTDTPYSRTLSDLLSSRSPSRVIQETLYSDWSLLHAVDAWNAVCNTFDSIDNPCNLHKLVFKEQDFYTAIVMDILEKNVSHSQADSMESFVKTSKSWIGEATAFVKLKFNIDNYEFDVFASDEDKKNIADAYMEYFQTELKFDTWDTNHAFLGYMDIVFKHYGTIMNTVNDLESFSDQIISAFALVAMSESTKNVVRELYDECPASNLPLRLALADIIKTMDSSETELVAELVSDGLTIVGAKMCSKVVDEFWSKAILNCVPEVKILISSYKAGKWVSDELFGSSKIAEECNKVIMTTVFESLMVSTVQELARKFNSTKDISSAETFLKSVDVYFSVLDNSANQAVSFTDAIDSGLLPKVWNHFSSSGNKSKEDLKKSIQSIRNSYNIQQDSLWNGWIYSLEDDYPDSGLYEKYCSELIDMVAKYSRERKKIQIHCPVNVFLYDSNDNLVAYVRDGKVHCDDDTALTLMVRGDEKTILFYDGADYRMECIGTGTGTMDAIITEYSSAGESIRDVYFYDLPLKSGTAYETDVNDQTLDNITYHLTTENGEILSADLDTYKPSADKYMLNIVSGAADIGGENVFSAELYAGQQVNIIAYTPKDCRFTGWTANVAEATFDDATQESTTLTMPADNVVIRATIAETGYSVIFDANGGTCDTVVIATDLDGKLDTLPTPSYSGYSFCGWFTATTGGSQLTVPTTLTENITVYAQWVQNTTPPNPTICTVTFNANGGTVSPSTMSTEADGTLARLPTPVRANYIFDGWHMAVTGGELVTIDTVFNSDATVYAQWIYAGPSPQPNPNPDDLVYYPNDIYISPTYSISTPTVVGGKVSVSPISASAGSTVTITAMPEAGYELTALTVADANGKKLELTDKGRGQYSFKMPNGRVSIDAEFRPVGIDVPWSNPFVDVSTGAWYYEAVKFVNQNGLMSGVGNGLFAPDTHLSRAMLAEILYNKEGRPVMAGGTSAFPDVPLNEWYADAVAWASGKSIVNGYGNGLFGPDDDITREQVAVMLCRYAGSPVPPNLLLNFTDAYKVSDWAQDAVRWAVDQGILNGKGNGILDPTGKATRAEVAQMLKNYLEK